VDYSRDECKRILRQLELDAYAGIVSAFRAQGDLNKEKKSLLQQLQNTLRYIEELFSVMHCCLVLSLTHN
jgi:hypothetical protein